MWRIRILNTIKRPIKFLLRPVARSILFRVEWIVNARAEPLETDVAALKQHIPSLLNTVSSLNSVMRDAKRAENRAEARLDELAAKVADLEGQYHSLPQQVVEQIGRIGEDIRRTNERVEFVRNEIMYEMKYRTHPSPTKKTTLAQLLNPKKFDEMRHNVRLNLGCGHIPLDGYLNVDNRVLPNVDVVAEVDDMPFGPGSADEIFSAHLLEHFPLEQMRRSLLPYWSSLLKPGALFKAVVPDAETMLAEYAAGRYPFEELRLVTYGGQEYDGDFHFNMFSKQMLIDCLEEVGFVDIKVPVVGRRNGACYEMEVSARKSSTAAKAPAAAKARSGRTVRR